MRDIYVTLKPDVEGMGRCVDDADRAVILTDSNVKPLLAGLCPLDLPVITIPAGESHKNISTCSYVWQKMSELGMTRHSMLINVGGGVVTDLGGFCAATYMRGIRFVNVSTTLLGGVDASIGGKTGVDLDGMKNRVGVFGRPTATFIPLDALYTLPEEEILSGYAEMVKTGYIGDAELSSNLRRGPLFPVDTEYLKPMVERCLEVKYGVTQRDPLEKGERKVLNFGHTAGHAFEEIMIRRGRPIPHGCAVAQGMLVALILSNMSEGFPGSDLYHYQEWLNSLYRPVPITCNDYVELLSLMRSDKKNRADGKVRFVLLQAIGKCLPDCPVEEKDIKIALDIYRDFTSQ